MDKSGPILKILFQFFEDENERAIGRQLVLREQNFITSYYDIFDHFVLKSNDPHVEKIFNGIKADIGQILYNYLKPFAYDDSVPNELKLEIDDRKFLFTFLDGAITTIDKKYYIYYDDRFKILFELFKEDTSVIVVEKKGIMIMEIYIGDILKETYELVQYSVEQNYSEVSSEGVSKGVTEIKSCPNCHKNVDSKDFIMCDNDCGTIYCECGYQYYKLGDKYFTTHNPICGKEETESSEETEESESSEESEDISDTDSVEEYKRHIQAHREAREKLEKLENKEDIKEESKEDKYVRKRIFRHEFYNDAVIKSLKLPEEVKEQVCKNFDKFSDDFSKKYESKIPFLPHQYLFLRLLSELGYNYPYISQVDKFQDQEDIFWSVKDVKDYDNFIFYVKIENMKKIKSFSQEFDKPLKFFIDKNISKNRRNYYIKTFLINAESATDVVLKYFTKYLAIVEDVISIKDIYNLFIFEMIDNNVDLTFENITRHVLNYLKREVVKLVEYEIEL